MVELLTITVKISFGFLISEELLTITVECFDSDGKQFYQYQQTKRKFEQ
jgi:hypothetical protein